jgi:uncharacterized protein (TIGR03086 family)
MDMLESLDKSAQAAATMARGVLAGQLDRPTPCSEWNVQQLMNHMIGSFEYFTARGEGKETGPPRPASPGSYAETVDQVVKTAAATAAAWRRPGALEQKVTTSFGEMNGAFVANIARTELLMHGWDLARATGQRLLVDQGMAGEILAEMEQTMLPQARQFAFGPEVAAPEGSLAIDRLAAFLGRQP